MKKQVCEECLKPVQGDILCDDCGYVLCEECRYDDEGIAFCFACWAERVSEEEA